MSKRVQKQQVQVDETDGREQSVVRNDRESSPLTPQPPVADKRRYLEAMVAATPDAVITLDQNYHVLDLNPAASHTLAWKTQDAVGQKCSDVLRCQNLNGMVLCGTRSCPLTQALKAQKPLANEDLMLGTKPGHACEFSSSVTPVTVDDGQHRQHVVFTARDLSALKVANQVRSNFVSMVSHELRTPLNSVHGFIDLLLQGHMGPLNKEQHTYLSYTQTGVQQLISIVEDILFMTRSDLGQFEIKQQEVVFRRLARQVLSSLQPQAQKAEVALGMDIPDSLPSLYADPQRIIQVLNNLITNAIKFTPPGGTVTIHARCYDEHSIMISVSDTGYGIPAQDQPHIFERFYQSNHNQQSKMGGYGLGLSIARLIVEQHSGIIDFETVPNHGTTFFFTIPMYKARKP